MSTPTSSSRPIILKTITRAGLGRGAFEVIRAEPGNVFDDPEYAGPRSS
jgi:hypothetical protein